MGLAGSKILRLCCPILRLCWSILGLCWPTLALCWPVLGPRLADWGYVGPSWGYVGPSWRQCGPSWGYVGPSWGYVGPSWGYVGPSWGLCWPILGLGWPILGVMLAHLGARLAHLEAYVGPCWPIFSHKVRKMGKMGAAKKHRKTRDFLGLFGDTRSTAAGGAAPLSYGEERTAVRQCHPWPDFPRLYLPYMDFWRSPHILPPSALGSSLGSSMNILRFGVP